MTNHALMAGGPRHGRMWTFTGRPPYQVIVAGRITPIVITFDTDPPPATMPDRVDHRYELRHYMGNESYPPIGPDKPLPVYLCLDDPRDFPRHSPADETEAWRLHIADSLWHKAHEETLPACVVPDCTDKARVTFIAAERGRLAGREWDYDDEIKVCPRHGYDIRRASVARGIDQLPEWLQPDATWDWIDTYDGGTDLLYGAEILNRTARMLRIKYPIKPEGAR